MDHSYLAAGLPEPPPATSGAATTNPLCRKTAVLCKRAARGKLTYFCSLSTSCCVVGAAYRLF